MHEASRFFLNCSRLVMYERNIHKKWTKLQHIQSRTHSNADSPYIHCSQIAFQKIRKPEYRNRQRSELPTQEKTELKVAAEDKKSLAKRSSFLPSSESHEKRGTRTALSAAVCGNFFPRPSVSSSFSSPSFQSLSALVRPKPVKRNKWGD